MRIGIVSLVVLALALLKLAVPEQMSGLDWWMIFAPLLLGIGLVPAVIVAFISGFVLVALIDWLKEIRKK